MKSAFLTYKSHLFKMQELSLQPARAIFSTDKSYHFIDLQIAIANAYRHSSSCPVTELIMKPRTITSVGTSGWRRIVSTVCRTEEAVSWNPSSHLFRSIPQCWMVSSVFSSIPLARMCSRKASKLM